MKPMDPPAATQDDGTVSCPVAAGPGVLVVDDDNGVRRVIEAGLKAHGFAVWSAANGPDGVESYRLYRGSIAVVLLDVRMPGRDGPATLTDLQRIDPAVVACFMTGFAGRYTDQHLLALGARAVFLKPLSLKGLAARLVELTVLVPHAGSPTKSPVQTLAGQVPAPVIVRGDRLP